MGSPSRARNHRGGARRLPAEEGAAPCRAQVMAEQPWAAQVTRDPRAGEERPLMSALHTAGTRHCSLMDLPLQLLSQLFTLWEIPE